MTSNALPCALKAQLLAFTLHIHDPLLLGYLFGNSIYPVAVSDRRRFPVVLSSFLSIRRRHCQWWVAISILSDRRGWLPCRLTLMFSILNCIQGSNILELVFLRSLL